MLTVIKIQCILISVSASLYYLNQELYVIFLRPLQLYSLLPGFVLLDNVVLIFPEYIGFHHQHVMLGPPRIVCQDKIKHAKIFIRGNACGNKK